MVSTFAPRKDSAKMHLQNSPAHAFGQNSPFLQKIPPSVKWALHHLKG